MHFHRDRLTAKGGPDGGDGGRGGHVIVRGSKDHWTLLHLRYRKHVHAKDGEPGGSTRKTGKVASDEVLEVPLGTQIKDMNTGELLYDITRDGEEKIILEGGQGGLGNTHFKSSVKQTPRYAQPGGPAQSGEFVLELRLLADAGMAGFPNAGKSTLLSVLSSARPDIADYPFTTMVPQLGVVDAGNDKSFVMADLPGIIEGAHEGKGLGHRFLRHIDRSSVLLFVISAENLDVDKQFTTLLNELEQYNPELLDRKFLVVINKSDLLDNETKNEIYRQIGENEHVFVSALKKIGLNQLKQKVLTLIEEK